MKQDIAVEAAKLQIQHEEFKADVTAMITAQIKHTEQGGTDLYLQKIASEKKVMDFLKIDRNLIV